MKIHTARKDHWCAACERKIPAGTRYWRAYETEDGYCTSDRKEHTNCLEFADQPHERDAR